MRVLIVGSGGVLGTAVHAGFEAVGHSVLGLGRSAQRARDQVRGVLMNMELPDPGLAECVAGFQADLCVHCAGPNSVPASVDNPEADFLGTVPPLRAVLEALHTRSPGTRLIYLSSAAVYGQPEQLPVAEGAAIAPISPYGAHRHQAERLVDQHRQTHGLLACSVRVFSAYGPALRRQVVWDLCQRAQEPGALTVWGRGDESRDFIHLDDLVRALVLLAQQTEWSDVYNLGSGQETPIADLARMIAARSGRGQPVEFVGESRPGLPQRWCADMRALAALGFAPRVSLEQGLDQVWAATQLVTEGAPCT